MCIKKCKTFKTVNGMQPFQVFTLVATVFTAFVDDHDHVLLTAINFRYAN